MSASARRSGRRRAAAVVPLAVATLVGTGHITAAAAPTGPPGLHGPEGKELPCTARTGPYQWQLEAALGLPRDGRQSPADCAAIRTLQRQLKVSPADGRATLATYRLLLVREAGRNPNALGRCPVKGFRVTCVDLDRQILWAQSGKRIVFPPVPIRTGRDGLETRRGWHRVYKRQERFFSTVYDNAPMPYSQFFNLGQAIHGTHKDLFASGSGGCVNMNVADAERLYWLLDVNDLIYVWGTKPGTGSGYRVPQRPPVVPGPVPHGKRPAAARPGAVSAG